MGAPAALPPTLRRVRGSWKHAPDQGRTSSALLETKVYKIELPCNGELPLRSADHDDFHALVHPRAFAHPAPLVADRDWRGREHRKGGGPHEHVAIGGIAPADRPRGHHRLTIVRSAATGCPRQLVRPDHDPPRAYRSRQLGRSRK